MKRPANLEEETTGSGSSLSLWDQVPEDVMELIFRNLWTGDRVRLRLVCKLWNHVLTQSRIPTAPELPWEIMSEDEQSYYTQVCFRSLSENRTYRFEFPVLDGLDNNRGWLCAYTRGWLVLAMGPNMNPFVVLWNPLSGATRRLPPLATLPFFDDLGKSPYGNQIVNFNRLIRRVDICSIGSVECVFVVLFRTVRGNRVALCTPSEVKWTPCNFKVELVDENREVEIQFIDILFHEGNLIALANNPFLTDINSENFLSTKLNISLMDCKLEVTPIVTYRDQNVPTEELPLGFGIATQSITNWFLVESSIIPKPLPLVIRTKSEVLHSNNNGKGLISKFDCMQMTDIVIFRSELIQKEVFFLGSTGSFTLPIVHGIVPDCVYFALNNSAGIVFDHGHSMNPYLVCERGTAFPNYEMHRYLSRTMKESSASKIGWFIPHLFMS